MATVWRAVMIGEDHSSGRKEGPAMRRRNADDELRYRDPTDEELRIFFDKGLFIADPYLHHSSTDNEDEDEELFPLIYSGRY
jgi:predicted ATPase